MKRWGLLVAAFVLIISAVGCSLFPTGENYSWGEKEAEVTIAEDSATGKLNDSINIDAKIIQPDNIQWKEYDASQRTMTEEEFNSIAEKLRSNNNNISEIKKHEGYFSCKYSDGTSFIFNSQEQGEFSIIYNTQKNINVQYASIIEDKNGAVLKESEIKDMLPNDEIDGLTKEDAVKKAKDICDKMNINVHDVPYLCVAMDYENVNKIIENEPRKGTNKYGEVSYWNKSDEAYYIVFQQEVDGVPITISNKTANFYMIPLTSVTVIVGRNGVLKVENHGLYSADSVSDCTIIDSKKAIDILATDSMYAAIGNMTLTDMSLEYTVYYDLKSNKVTIKPMWVYTLERTTTMDKDGQTYTSISRQTNFIDAVTGKVLGG